MQIRNAERIVHEPTRCESLGKDASTSLFESAHALLPPIAKIYLLDTKKSNAVRDTNGISTSITEEVRIAEPGHSPAGADSLKRNCSLNKGGRPVEFYLKPSVFEKSLLPEFVDQKDQRYGRHDPLNAQRPGPTTLMRSSEQNQIKLALPSYKSERKSLGFFF